MKWKTQFISKSLPCIHLYPILELLKMPLQYNYVSAGRERTRTTLWNVFPSLKSFIHRLDICSANAVLDKRGLTIKFANSSR